MNRTSIPSFCRPALLASLLPLGACDPLTGPDYPGEPMLTLSGEVSSALEAGEAPDGIRVAIVWVAGEASGGKFPVADSAEVSGEFPASFTLNVYHPPEEPSLLTLDAGGRVGIGFIVALPEDAALGDAIELEQMLGVSNRHVVIYAPTADDAVAAREISATLQTLEAGFNLVDAATTTPEYETCRTDAVAAIDSCFADCDANCDPDSAEDPGCDICTGNCETYSDQFHACDSLIDLVVPSSTNIDLELNPDAVSESAVWSVFSADSEDPARENVDDANE